MAKNVVICCDGTGNEFGEQNSNVVKLYKILVSDAGQVTYYHPGIGTMGARNALTRVGKWWTRVIGLAFGYGISDNVADAYEFLIKNFHPDDRVYVFGFSRGAYTARALCGMLHIVGLLTEGNEGLIPYAIRMIKRSEIDFKVAAWAFGIPSAPSDGSTTQFIFRLQGPRKILTFILSDTLFPLMSAEHSFVRTPLVSPTTLIKT